MPILTVKEKIALLLAEGHAGTEDEAVELLVDAGEIDYPTFLANLTPAGRERYEVSA